MNGRVDGIVLLDKPSGLSSNAALQRVKRALGADKAGHAGTLDPLATGMLPILLGEATKIAGHLLHQDKAYAVDARLGQTTDSADADGTVTLERPVPALSTEQVEAALVAFTGRIRQRAPVISAIKQGGQPLYRRVRRGEAVVAPEREVRIDAIVLESLASPLLSLRVTCGSGTYIRSLVHDLGERLGCGAHVTGLRRLWVDPFRNLPMVSLAAVQDGTVVPLPTLAGLANRPYLVLTDGELAAIRQGRRVDRPGHAPGFHAGLDPAGQLAALLEVGPEGHLRSLRVLREAG